jgi:hypothetical protein
MPWPLTQAELALAGGPLRVHRIEKHTGREYPPRLWWRAEFRRDA